MVVGECDCRYHRALRVQAVVAVALAVRAARDLVPA